VSRPKGFRVLLLPSAFPTDTGSGFFSSVLVHLFMPANYLEVYRGNCSGLRDQHSMRWRTLSASAVKRVTAVCLCLCIVVCRVGVVAVVTCTSGISGWVVVALRTAIWSDAVVDLHGLWFRLFVTCRC